MSPGGEHVRSFIDEFLEGHGIYQGGIFISSSESFQRKIWGRKRHALVDCQGYLLAVKVTGAERSDQEGGRTLLLPFKEQFPKMTLLWGDSHYAGQMITWMNVNLGWTMQPVRALTVPKRGVLVPEGEEVDWDKLFPSGFRPLPRRWVVERSFVWITQWRRLCRDHEGLPQSSEAFIKISASYRMLTKLAPSFPITTGV